ncbi:MAG: YceI family protein [Phototrophicaceae bacterium]
MNIRNIIIGLVVLALVIIGGAVAFLSFSAGDGEASQDIADVAQTVDDAGTATVMTIVSDESEASFTLEEDLRGTRTTVVGVTDQVGGEIAINFDNPTASTIGTITINARTIATDNDFRNQALRSQILRSARDEYEFITFEPTSITGLPDSITIGETYTFDIIGNLTIIDTTEEVTFTTDVTIVSETEISGSASSSVIYADWGINIPNVPGVANVETDADLVINFVARTAE